MAEARRDTGLRRHLRDAFTRRLAYKGAAFFFAIVLWLVVSGEEPGERTIPLRVVIEHDSARSLVGGAVTVRAVVTGKTRELIKLVGASLELRRTIDADAPDSVRLFLRALDVRLPPDADVTVRELHPASLLLHFDVRLARLVPVEPRVRVVLDPLVASAGRPRVDPESVTVSGPRAEVMALRGVPTMPTTVVVRETTSSNVPLDLAALGRLRVNPSAVRVTFAATRLTQQ